MTDTHSHPYLADSPQQAIDSVRRALSAGVDRIIMPNTDVSTISPMNLLAKVFPSNIRMAMGLHPTEVKEDADEQLNIILNELNSNRDKYIAVGEIGLDFYWDRTFESKQKDIFTAQLELAKSLGLPVIIHCREALDEVLEILTEFPGIQAVFHSFGGTADDVEKISHVGNFYFGINGIITFKNSALKETLPAIPRNRLLLETDSPYLAPVPKRGKPNESSYLPYIAQFIASCLKVPINEVIELTSQNSANLFGF